MGSHTLERGSKTRCVGFSFLGFFFSCSSSVVALMSSLTLYSCTGKEPCCIAPERFTKEISKITCTMAWERTPFQMDALTKASFARTGINKNPFLTGTVQHIDKARENPSLIIFIMPFYTLFFILDSSGAE